MPLAPASFIEAPVPRDAQEPGFERCLAPSGGRVALQGGQEAIELDPDELHHIVGLVPVQASTDKPVYLAMVALHQDSKGCVITCTGMFD